MDLILGPLVLFSVTFLCHLVNFKVYMPLPLNFLES